MAAVAGCVLGALATWYLVEVGIDLKDFLPETLEFGGVVFDPVLRAAWDFALDGKDRPVRGRTDAARRPLPRHQGRAHHAGGGDETPLNPLKREARYANWPFSFLASRFSFLASRSRFLCP